MTNAAPRLHRHAHDHDHDHDHGHNHEHDHAPAPAQGRGPAATGGASLLSLSAGLRTFGLSALLTMLWASVYWALH